MPAHRALRAAISAAGGTAAAVTGPAWTAAVEEHLSDEPLRSGVHALAVEPLRATAADSQERYADSMLAPHAGDGGWPARSPRSSRRCSGSTRRSSPRSTPGCSAS